MWPNSYIVYKASIIMQEISQQPEEDHLAALKAEAQAEQVPPFTLHTLHQLDCTYYGELNRSYQKEGIGVLLTLSFQTYLGFWKNNRPDGRGLVIFASGEIIYGEFIRSALSGAGIIDDGKFLRVGVFEGLDIQGIGFEYTYPTSKWRMIKYVRGAPVEQLREEVMPLEMGLPAMLAAQHSLHQMLHNYREGHFFFIEQPKPKKGGKSAAEEKYRDVNKAMVNKKESLMAIGFRDQGGLHGLGVIINRRDQSVIEAGYYVGGHLQGYCLESTEKYRQFGPFFAGVRHGTFLRQSNHGKEVVDFIEDKEKGESSVSEEQIYKRQRSYNFEQKDFLSARNTIDFESLFLLFTPPEARHRKSQTSKSKDVVRQPSYPSPESRPLPKRQLLRNQRISHTFLAEGEERSCIDMMRQKIRGYDMVRNERAARLTSEERRKNILNSNLRFGDQEQSIAEEENPFDSALRGTNLLHESPARRH